MIVSLHHILVGFHNFLRDDIEVLSLFVDHQTDIIDDVVNFDGVLLDLNKCDLLLG